MANTNPYFRTGESVAANIDLIFLKHFNQLQKTLPYRTGNLRSNGFQVRRVGNELEIYIDLSEAEYALYLDNDGIHKGFIDHFTQQFITRFTEDLKQQYPTISTGGKVR